MEKRPARAARPKASSAESAAPHAAPQRARGAPSGPRAVYRSKTANMATNKAQDGVRWVVSSGVAGRIGGSRLAGPACHAQPQPLSLPARGARHGRRCVASCCAGRRRCVVACAAGAGAEHRRARWRARRRVARRGVGHRGRRLPRGAGVPRRVAWSGHSRLRPNAPRLRSVAGRRPGPAPRGAVRHRRGGAALGALPASRARAPVGASTGAFAIAALLPVARSDALAPRQSALASLRARGGGEAAALAGTLRWLAAVADVFAAPLRPGDASPLLAPDPDCGGALPLVPARCLAPHDAGAPEREALGLPPRPLAAPECAT